MGNLSRCKYRPGVNGSSVGLGFFVILLWMTLTGYARVDGRALNGSDQGCLEVRGNGEDEESGRNSSGSQLDTMAELSTLRAECRTNGNCPSDRACITQTCRDPCEDYLDLEVDCEVLSHLPYFTCPDGYMGDPYVQCFPLTESDVESEDNFVYSFGNDGLLDGESPNPADHCQGHAECPDDYACIEHACSDPCWETICGPTAVCFVQDHRAFCDYPYNGGGQDYCHDESECAYGTVCVGNTCLDPCSVKTCGTSAVCVFKDDEAVCSCRPGWSGDPDVECHVEIETKTVRALFDDPVEETNVPTVHPGFCGEPEMRARSIGLAISATDELSEYLAGELFTATSTSVIDYGTIRVILTPLVNNSLIEAASRSLLRRSNMELKEFMFHITQDDLKLWSIVDFQLKGRGSSNDSAGETIASDDSDRIWNAIESGKWKEADNDFHNVLLTSSYSHLRKVINHYKQFHGDTLEQAINDAFAPNVAQAYIDILQFAEDGVGYFVTKLKRAISPIDRIDIFGLVCIVAWRAEIDLGDIKIAYRNSYGSSLYEDINVIIKEDVLRSLLLAIIGE